MIKVNKNLAMFLGLSFLLSLIVVTALQKMLTTTVKTSLSYCQTVLKSLTLPIPHHLEFLPIMLFIILIGVVLTKLIVTYIRIYLVRQSFITETKKNKQFSYLLKKYNLQNNTLLIKNKKIFAFCFGIRRPKIYVSTSLLTAYTREEVETILLHEKYHLENNDTRVMLLASLTESLFPFFPIISDFVHNYQIEREIKADEAAMKTIGADNPLLTVLKKLLLANHTAIAYASAIGNTETLEPRIKTLVQKEYNFKQFRFINVLVSFFSLAIIFGLITLPAHAVEIHTAKEDAVMLCVSKDSCVQTACKAPSLSTQQNSLKQKLLSPQISHNYSPLY